MNLIRPRENVFCKLDYLVDRELMHDQEFYCLICMEMLIEPKECTRCRGVFCAPCTINWKKINNRCPKKCSTGDWTLKTIPNKKYVLRCPYDARCQPFGSEEWEKHLVYCPFAPKSVRMRLELMSSKRCDNGHQLTNCKVNAQCADCEEGTVCLSECETCALKYCKRCRLPEIYKVVCANSHKYTTTTSEFTCDVCFKQCYEIKGYCDAECKLTVCKECMKDLPRHKDEEEILRSLKRNRRYSAGNIAV